MCGTHGTVTPNQRKRKPIMASRLCQWILKPPLGFGSGEYELVRCHPRKPVKPRGGVRTGFPLKGVACRLGSSIIKTASPKKPRGEGLFRGCSGSRASRRVSPRADENCGLGCLRLSARVGSSLSRNARVSLRIGPPRSRPTDEQALRVTGTVGLAPLSACPLQLPVHFQYTTGFLN
jgi:hypothetical protein